jgi:hypothetical protein
VPGGRGDEVRRKDQTKNIDFTLILVKRALVD